MKYIYYTTYSEALSVMHFDICNVLLVMYEIAWRGNSDMKPLIRFIYEGAMINLSPIRNNITG